MINILLQADKHSDLWWKSLIVDCQIDTRAIRVTIEALREISRRPRSLAPTFAWFIPLWLVFVGMF